MPATANRLLAKDFAHLAASTVWSQLRVEHTLVIAPRRRADSNVSQVADRTVELNALALELTLVAMCAIEARIETKGTDPVDPQRLIERIAELSKLDPLGVYRDADAAGLLKNLPPADPRVPPMTEIVRAARAIIEACPIVRLEALAAERDSPAWGYRCRFAYEGLRAFVRRCDPQEENRLGILGREYQRGVLSVEEIAAVLRIDPMDAVVLLEECGHAKPVERIRLTEEDKRERFEAIRSDRLNRQGKFAPTSGQIAREVIASERIEGVDARPWLRSAAE